jgi:hypothetical protein
MRTDSSAVGPIYGLWSRQYYEEQAARFTRADFHGNPRCGYGPSLQSYAGAPHTPLRERPSLPVSESNERMRYSEGSCLCAYGVYPRSTTFNYTNLAPLRSAIGIME